MESEESGVAIARFTGGASMASVGAARRWVIQFAREHGMHATADVALAVSEAVRTAVRHAYPPGARGDLMLDAATDGEWLTVRVADRGGAPAASLGLGAPLVARLAHRIEIAPGDGGVGTVVLMEFPMRVEARGPG
jgi:anti-sigma regulatory factor (Ser/Thr protein kinase)